MKQILVVDDNGAIVLAASLALSKAGYEVRCAGSGSAAIASYKEARADLVILDIIMEDMDGLETYKALRAMDPQVIVLGISGPGTQFTPLYLNTLRKLGAQATLEKPFTVETLVHQVDNLIGPAMETRPRKAA